MNSTRLQHIDTWRFVAIAFVLASHILAHSHPWYATLIPRHIWQLKLLGLVGVKIFFCISGYVICRGMMREYERTGTVDMPGFYRRRAYRILPPLFAYIVVVAVLFAIGVFDVPAYRLAQAAAFLCNITPLGECDWALGHTWSLAYEEQFYLVFPLLFSLAVLMPHRARLLLVIGALIGGCILTHWTRHVLLNACLSYFLCMLAGCACALYWDRLQPVLRALPLPLWLAAVLAVPASALFVTPAYISEIAYPVLLPVLISVAVFGTPTGRPVVHRLFTLPLFAHLGRISYSIYLWQQLATADYGFASPLSNLWLLAGAFCLAQYSYRYVEQPLIARGAATARATPVQGAAVFGASFDDPLSGESGPHLQ